MNTGKMQETTGWSQIKVQVCTASSSLLRNMLKEIPGLTTDESKAYSFPRFFSIDFLPRSDLK